MTISSSLVRVEQRVDRIRRGNFGDHKGLGSGVSNFGSTMVPDIGCTMGGMDRMS